MLALGACDQSVYDDWSRQKTAERADIADANARTSLMRIDELKSELSDLQGEVEKLQARLKVAEINTSTLFEKAGPSIDGWQTEAIETLFENDRKIAARAGVPFQAQPPN